MRERAGAPAAAAAARKQASPYEQVLSWLHTLGSMQLSELDAVWLQRADTLRLAFYPQALSGSSCLKAGDA